MAWISGRMDTKVTERALETFTPAEREMIIHALQDIRRNLTAD